MAEIFGQAWTETAKDKVKVLLDALLATMAAGYDPTFSYTYDRHNVADLDLNAVTVSALDFETEPIGAGTNPLTNHMIRLSIRVHTAYNGGVEKSDTNIKLLNSIANKLLNNENLLNNYRVEQILDVEATKEFEESGSLGGELIAIISFIETHIQE